MRELINTNWHLNFLNSDILPDLGFTSVHITECPFTHTPPERSNLITTSKVCNFSMFICFFCEFSFLNRVVCPSY